MISLSPNSVGSPTAILYDSLRQYIAFGHTITYTVSSDSNTCQIYILRQECESNNYCSGKYIIHGGQPVPSQSPTPSPSGPSIQPTLSTVIPTTVTPSFATVTVCPPYSASNTLNAQQNYSSCSFSACPGSLLSITASLLYDNMNILIILLDGYGNVLKEWSSNSLTYTTTYVGDCEVYTLREGCVGSTSCRSQLTVNGGAPASTSPTAALPSLPPTFAPTSVASLEPTSVVTLLVNLTLSTSNEGVLTFVNIDDPNLITSCSRGALQPNDLVIESNIELQLNNWYQSEFSYNTFNFVISVAGPSNGSYLALSSVPGRVCLNSTSNNVVQFQTSRVNLTYFTPSEGSQHGLDYVRIYPAYPIIDLVGPSLTFNSSNVTLFCLFGPAVDEAISTQNLVITSARIDLETNSVFCNPGHSDPLLPFNVETYRDVELWLLWFAGFNSTSVQLTNVSTISNIFLAEMYGSFTFLQSTGSQTSKDVSYTMPFPGSVYIFNPVDNTSLVSYVEFFGVNRSQGAVMDLGIFISQCRLINGSMKITFYNFSANPESVNISMEEKLAAEKYIEVGSFTGYFILHEMNIGLYAALWSENATFAALDPFWCIANEVALENEFAEYFRRRLQAIPTGTMPCNSFLQSIGDSDSLLANQREILSIAQLANQGSVSAVYKALNSIAEVCQGGQVSPYVKVAPYSNCYNSDIGIAGQCICQEWLAENQGKEVACSYSISENFDMSNVVYSLWLSAAAYCDSGTYKGRDYVGIIKDFIAFQEICDCIACVCNLLLDIDGIIGYSASKAKIYVAFRGTQGLAALRNWITNLNAEFFPYSGGDGTCTDCRVHDGFYAAAISVIDTVRQTLVKLQSMLPTYSVVVTGHSLGGAVATLIALDLITRTPSYDVMLINFGSPRVGDPNFAAWASMKLKEHFRFTHNRDIVPHLPPAALSYQHISGEIYESSEGQLSLCAGYEDTRCSSQWLKLSIDDHTTYLDLKLTCDSVSVGPNLAGTYDSSQGMRCPPTLFEAIASPDLKPYQDTIISEMGGASNSYFIDSFGHICGYI